MALTRTTLLLAAGVLLGAPAAASRPHAPPLAWRAPAAGIEVAELALGDAATARTLGLERAARVRVVLVRVDAHRHALRLHAAVENGRLVPWSVARAPAEAVVALNAGQYEDGGPWGWLTHDGRELQPPGTGALASALVATRDGAVRILDAAEIDSARASGGVLEAVQSYPALLVGDGEIPAALRTAGSGVDLAHRDGRLGACTLADGRLLVLLTRFDAPVGTAGSALAALPVGLTVPETAALARAMGCRRALLLDGGLSAQLLVRGADGRVETWPGLRKVPLGIVLGAR